MFRPLWDRRIEKLVKFGGSALDNLAMPIELVGRIIEHQDHIQLLAIIRLAFRAVEGGVVPATVVVRVMATVDSLRDEVMENLDNIEQRVGVPVLVVGKRRVSTAPSWHLRPIWPDVFPHDYALEVRIRIPAERAGAVPIYALSA